MFNILRNFYKNIFTSPTHLLSLYSSNGNFIRCFCASNIELLRIIGKDGQNMGLMSHDEAKKLAVEQGYILSKIAEKSSKIENSVYKLVSEQNENSKQILNVNKSTNTKKHLQKTKEITLKTSIDVNDMKRKSKKLQEFLEDGYHVTVKIVKPGRSRVLPKEAFEQLTSHITCAYKIPNTPKEGEKFFRCSLFSEENKRNI